MLHAVGPSAVNSWGSLIYPEPFHRDFMHGRTRSKVKTAAGAA